MNPLILIIIAVAGYAIYAKSKSTTPSNSSSNDSGNALSNALSDLESGNWSDAMNAISGGQATEQNGGPDTVQNGLDTSGNDTLQQGAEGNDLEAADTSDD